MQPMTQGIRSEFNPRQDCKTYLDSRWTFVIKKDLLTGLFLFKLSMLWPGRDVLTESLPVRVLELPDAPAPPKDDGQLSLF